MNLTVKAGESIFLRIRNDYSEVLNVALLNLQSDWAINQLDLLNEGVRFEPFDPGQEELIHTFIQQRPATPALFGSCAKISQDLCCKLRKRVCRN